ncbi:MAG: hypothetical protein AB7I19_18075 [Planctomycetota bacterium]
MRPLVSYLALSLTPALLAQGVVPPLQITQLNSHPSLSAGSVPGSNVQQVHLVPLPGSPSNQYLVGLTAGALQAGFGGVGGTDLLTGIYDSLTDTFAPDNLAAALNTSGTEFGLMISHDGLLAVFDRLPGLPQLATRSAVGAPWSLVGTITGLPTQSYYDPALARYRGAWHLLHVLGSDIAMTPIDVTTGALTGASRVLVQSAIVGSTANSPTPVVDSNGELIGLSHHDVVGSDNDHYMSMDLDPLTSSVLLNDTTTWTNNGGFVGGRFFDAENSPAPYHVFSIDTYWCTGGRAPVGGAMELRVFTPPSNAAPIYVSYMLFGGAFTVSGVTIPGINGALGLANVIAAASMPPHDNANGTSLLTLMVPNQPALSGLVLPVQSLTLDVTGGTLNLGNTAAMTID